MGIDYCCGGKRTLAAACAEGKIARRIGGAGFGGLRWPRRSRGSWRLDAHFDEPVDRPYRRGASWLSPRELPRLVGLIAKVLQAHGCATRLAQVQRIFAAFRDELEAHMMKEERILFPMIRQIEAAAGPVALHCGTVENPIGVMVAEHDNAGQALRRMRELTDDYTAPPEACNTYRAMLEGLHELEADMHRHVHEENNILFPKALR